MANGMRGTLMLSSHEGRRASQGLGASQQREREVAAGGEALAGAGDRSSASALRAPTAAICDSRTLHFSNAGI